MTPAEHEQRVDHLRRAARISQVFADHARRKAEADYADLVAADVALRVARFAAAARPNTAVVSMMTGYSPAELDALGGVPEGTQ